MNVIWIQKWESNMKKVPWDGLQQKGSSMDGIAKIARLWREQNSLRGKESEKVGWMELTGFFKRESWKFTKQKTGYGILYGYAFNLFDSLFS